MTVEGFCLKDCQRVNSDVTFFYRQPPFRNLTAVQGLNFSVPRQKLKVCETGSLGKLGEKVPTSSPAPMLLKEPCETGNVYAPDPEKECFRSLPCAYSEFKSRDWLCTEPIFRLRVRDVPWSRFTVHRKGFFFVLFLRGVCRKIQKQIENLNNPIPAEIEYIELCRSIFSYSLFYTNAFELSMFNLFNLA